LYDAPIFIDDSPAQSVLEIRAKSRRWKNELGLKLVIIDYPSYARQAPTAASKRYPRYHGR
jgi:replicative DNA helicase